MDFAQLFRLWRTKAGFGILMRLNGRWRMWSGMRFAVPMQGARFGTSECEWRIRGQKNCKNGGGKLVDFYTLRWLRFLATRIKFVKRRGYKIFEKVMFLLV